MDIYAQIKRKLEEIAGSAAEGTALFTAEVKSVEGETCTVIVGGLEVPDVLLTPADEGADGKLVITPRQGSMVTVADLSGGRLRRLAVVHWGEVEKIACTCDSVEFNGGDLGGLVKIEKLTEKINTIERDLNKLKGVFSAWTTVAQDGGAALKTAAADWASQTLTETQTGDYEDTKIKH